MIAFFSDLDPAPTPAMDRHHQPPEPPPSPQPDATPPPPSAFAKAFWTCYFQKVGSHTEIIEVKSLSRHTGHGVEISIPARGQGWTFTSAEQIDAFAEILKQALVVDPLTIPEALAGSAGALPNHPPQPQQ